MSQINQIVQLIKKQLKAHNLNYADVAKLLNLSEASVKRLFAQRSFSLKRLEKICNMLNIELSDLFQALTKTKALQQLKLQEEHTIANDLKLLLVVVCVINHWTLADILQHYDLTYHECIQKLSYLDKIKLIELLPKDKIKLKISPNFSWLPNGPIKRFFAENLQQDFLHSSFTKQNEFFMFRFGMLSDESNAILRRKLQDVMNKFVDLVQDDINKDESFRDRSGLLVSLRPWQPKLFDQFKK